MAEVELTIPPELFGGSSRGLLAHLGLRGRALGRDRWAVRPTDDRGFLDSHELADERGFVHRFDRLEHAPEIATIEVRPVLAEAFRRQRQSLIRRAEGGDISALLHSIQLNVVTAQPGHLVETVRDAYAAIGNMPVETTWQPAFGNRSAHLVVAEDLLIRRVNLPRILLRFDQDPDAPELLKEAANGVDNHGLFGSSTPWFFNVIGGAHYLGPLLGCLSPRFWCLAAPRGSAAILFSLGSDIVGHFGTPYEPMQLISTPGRTEAAPQLDLDDTSCARAIHWWRVRLNQMWQYLSDPTTFGGADKVYSPYAHHHWMLTFGETFGLMTSLQCSSRDANAQRSIMNNLFDLLGRITGTDIDRLCTLSYAEKRAADVRSKMLDSEARLLMPAVDRALQALKGIQDGFFIQRQRGDENVRLHLPDGSVEEKTPERASAMLLKLIRNATHGYGGKAGSQRKSDVDAALLAHHDGQIPGDIVLLPYLYLLDILCNPERVRDSIMSRRKPGASSA